MIDFGKCLQYWQAELNMSSAQLARNLNVHRQQVNIWRNKKNVRLDTFIKVSLALGVPFEQFLLADFLDE
jgi:transcriptional regulator with XRE-family HTH domain